MPDKSIEILRENLLKQTKAELNKEISNDKLVTILISTIGDLKSGKKNVIRRIRTFYKIYRPELNVKDDQEFLDQIKTATISEMGAKIPKKIVSLFKEIADNLEEPSDLDVKLKKELEIILKKHSPNLLKTTTLEIAAKLIKQAGTLEKLAMMPSSKIQLLGAEKAFFKYLKDKKRSPPKHGIIFNHPSVQSNENPGKAARELAAKISIAARKDYFNKER